MFTIKAIHRGGGSYHAYESSAFTVDEINSTVAFHEPGKADAVVVCLGRIYERIVVENSAAKTIANMSYRPGVPELELPSNNEKVA